MSEIYKIGQAGCMIYLVGMSVLDIRSRKLPAWLLASGGILAVLYHLCQRELSPVLVISGGVVGILFLAVSKVTEEAFGYGDSVLIGVVGIYLGLWNLLSLLVITFLLSAICAMLMLTKRSFTRKTALPFVPFLGSGYLAILLLGGF